MSSFVGKLQAFIAAIAPWYIRGKNTGTFLESVGMTYDNSLGSLVQGLQLGQPLACDVSALPGLSRDRGIRIYPTEPEISRRFRLSRWWQLHRQRATQQGEMRHLQPYFMTNAVLPVIRMIHQAGDGSVATWHTLNSDGSYDVQHTSPSNWDWDGQTAQWSRVFALIDGSTLLDEDDPDTYDGGNTYDDGTHWDGDPNTVQIADIVAMFRDWMGPHEKLWAVGMYPGGELFEPGSTAVTDADGWTSLPTGNWGRPIDDATGLPSRPPYLSLIYDVGVVDA